MIKIKNDNIVKISVISLLIVCYKFFYLFPLPAGYGNRSNQLIYVPFTIFFILITFLFYKFSGYLFIFSRYLLIIFFLLICELIFTLFRYPEEPMSNSITQIIPYLSLFSYYLFSIYSQENLTKFIKLIILFSSLASAICIIEYILYTKMGVSIFKIYGFNYNQNADLSSNTMGIVRANGRQRLIGCDLIDYSIVGSFCSLISKKINIPKIEIYINIVLVYLYELFVAQTRSIFFYSITIFLIIIILKSKFLFKKTLIYSVTLAFCLFIVRIIRIQLIYRSDYSLFHRIDEAEFYFSRFFSSPLFGNGLLKDKPLWVENYMLIHGTNIYASNSYNDIGLIGQIGNFGMIGLVISLYFPIKVFKYLFS